MKVSVKFVVLSLLALVASGCSSCPCQKTVEVTPVAPAVAAPIVAAPVVAAPAAPVAPAKVVEEKIPAAVLK